MQERPETPGIFIIYNPNAGQNKKGLFRRVVKILEDNGASIEIFRTEYAGHAKILARELAGKAAQRGRHDIICAAGGDGTINEVINGLYPAPLPFAVIPLGTANILAKEILSGETAEIIAGTILTGTEKECWLGNAHDQYFSSMVSMGLDAQAVKAVNLSLKKYLGKMAYALAFLRQVLVSSSVSYQVTIDDRPYQAVSVIISKGRYYGGKYLCAPMARIGKPELHILLFERKGRWAALIYALKMILNRIPADKSVKCITGHKISVCADRASLYQIDGDAGRELPVTITLSSACMTVLHDRNIHY